MTTEKVTATANDYSLYCDVNFKEKIKPVDNLIEILLTRLEEFQILLEFIKRNGIASDNVTSILSYMNEFDEICNKIDRVESLVHQVKNNLDKLEGDIAKAETNLGFGESSIKVPGILTPLFKKTDKKAPLLQLNKLNMQDYFNPAADGT